MEKRRVVVTGIGAITPNANSVEEFRQALFDGKSGIRYFAQLADHNFSAQVGGRPHGYENKLSEYFTSEDLLAMNEVMIFAGIAGIDAWKDAGLPIIDRKTDEVNWNAGAIIGLGLGGMDTIAEKIIPNVLAKKIRRIGSSAVEQIMGSSVSAKLGGLLALGNQVSSNSSACNTGTEAIVEAVNRIQFGLADVMLAGGAERGDINIWAGFDAMRVLSSKFNEDPEKASRPMSATAGGFVPGSGAGILVLESLEHARKRGARIYAEVIGTALNSGGHRMGGSMTAPNATSVQRAIAQAVADAGIKGTDLDYINGHLTGTFADPYEVNNWRVGLGVTPETLPHINSTKSMIGHGLGSAGGMEAVALILQMTHGFVHRSLNTEDIHEEILPYVNSVAVNRIEKEIKIAAKASFGFGDVNGVTIYRKWEN